MSKTPMTNGAAHETVSSESKEDDDRPLAHPLLAEIIMVIVAALLRNLVVKALERGKFVHTKKDKDLLKSSPARRVALVGVKRLANRSVPGAMAVGAGLVLQSFYKQRKSGKPGSPPPSSSD